MKQSVHLAAGKGDGDIRDRAPEKKQNGSCT